jgi:hypothetical protein
MTVIPSNEINKMGHMMGPPCLKSSIVVMLRRNASGRLVII